MKRKQQRETEAALQRCHELSIETCKMASKGPTHIGAMMDESWAKPAREEHELEPTAAVSQRVSAAVPRHEYT